MATVKSVITSVVAGEGRLAAESRGILTGSGCNRVTDAALSASRMRWCGERENGAAGGDQ
jgi:hypothetical protein